MYTSVFALILIFIWIFIDIKQSRQKKKKKAEEEIKEKMENAEHERLKRELNDLIDSIIADWNISIYSDKVETPGTDTIKYRFENGNTILLKGRTLVYTTSTRRIEYTLGLIYKSRVVGVFNRIVEIINEGKTARRQKSYGGKTYTSPTSSNASSSNPRQIRYDTIMETIKLIKEKLSKMSGSDPERPALENELNVAERKAREIKMELQN